MNSFENNSEFYNKNIYVFYNHKYSKTFEKLNSHETQLGKNIFISLISYKPEKSTENSSSENSFSLYNRVFKNVAEITKDDILIYVGDEQDKILSELSMRFINTNKLFLIDSEFKLQEITSIMSNRIFYKRFNLIQKAKESEVFGILVGSLSIDGLNEIIEEVKLTLKAQNKKFYTFLLGKITPEKLSNFVEYIDCFILIACPFNTFYDFKTLMRPLVNSLDIKIAFDPNFTWDMKYTFDPNYIIDNKKCLSKNLIKNEDFEVKVEDLPTQKFDSLKLLESEKNQALAQVFSVKVLETYDQKRYKGLDITEGDGEIQKFKIGKTGIPIKYEDIK